MLHIWNDNINFKVPSPVPDSYLSCAVLCVGMQGVINKLEQEKGKLELYAHRTLSSFKDKYMNALQTMKVSRV